MLHTWYSNRNVTLVKILKIHYTFVRIELILHVDMRGNWRVHSIT